jgi:hypothetical protein
MPWLTRGVRSYRFWRVASRWLLTGSAGIPLRPDGPVQDRVRGRLAGGLLLAVAWLAFAPLLASLLLPPRFTGLLAGWTVLLGLGLALGEGSPAGKLAPRAFATPLGMHPELHPSTFSVRTGDRLLFFTDGLLEARDRAGRFFRLDEHIQTLRRPDLQSAADELLDRLRAHTRHRLNDDVALLLVELTLTESAGRTPDEHPWPATPRRLATS